MKKNNLFPIYLPLSLFQLLSQLTLLLAFVIIAGCQPKREIRNPYCQVDWKNHQQYKANLHTHTTRSDGGMTPQNVVDSYQKLGYQILAITDHNEFTYPWTEFETLERTQQAEERLDSGEVSPEDLIYENRVPEKVGMIAVPGTEISAPEHIGSYFSNTRQRTDTVVETLDATAASNGLAIFNHPGKYQNHSGWYIDLLQKYKHIVGIEVYNQGDRYPNDRQLWDSVLVKLMPGRAVWGLSNDDLHGIKRIGRNWNIFILPGLSMEWVRRGLEEGRFLFVYSPGGHPTQNLPRIESINVNPQKTTIEILSAGQDSLNWISGGKVVHRGSEFSLKDHPEVINYVRAEIYGSGNTIVGTQPFAIIKNK